LLKRKRMSLFLRTCTGRNSHRGESCKVIQKVGKI
jgi:hypothetical protein